MSNYIRADYAGGHIKPCPHCGNLHTVFWDQGKGNEFGENVQCELCSPTMGLEQWNNRPTERVFIDKIVRLKALNAELLEALKKALDIAMEELRGVDPRWFRRSKLNQRLKELRAVVAKTKENKSCKGESVND